jgi:cytochrome c556
MPMPRLSAPRLLLAAASAALLCGVSFGGADHAAASAPAAAGRSQATITARQDGFKAIGGAFKAVRGELEKDSPDFALIAAKAGDINKRARKITGLFPAGTSNADGFKTAALPAIWSKPAGFKAAAKRLVDESAKLASLAGKRDKQAVAAQAMKMGGACKGCHDQFRAETN